MDPENKIQFVATKATEPPKPADKPPGWWGLPALQGTPEGIIKAIEVSNIPDRWKAALKAEVEAVADYNLIYLDAHYFVEGPKASLSLTIERAKQLS